MVLLRKVLTLFTQPLVGSEKNACTPLRLLASALLNAVASATFSVLSWPLVWMPRFDSMLMVPDNPETEEKTEERNCDAMLLAVKSPVNVPAVVLPVESVLTICWALMAVWAA